MPIVKRPTKDELVVMKKQGTTDKEIAKIYGIKRRKTIGELRRRYDIQRDGSYWPPNYCPNCERYVSQFLENGVCPACNKFQRIHNRRRTKADMQTPGGTEGWCKRCRVAPAFHRKLCVACYDYQSRTGRARPMHLIKRDKCKNPNCGRPWQPAKFRLGYCYACRRYRHLYNTDRPLELCRKQAPHGWCDCGEPATHADVELPVFTGEGNETAEKYNFCDLHYQWAMEDTPTRNEAVWNR